MVYVGGAVAITVQSTGAAESPGQFLRYAEIAGRAVGAGAALTLITGVALVLESAVWGFSMFFVYFGIAALVVSGAVDSLYTRRQTQAIEATIDEEGPESPSAGLRLRRVGAVNASVLLLMLAVIWTMVFKTGA